MLRRAGGLAFWLAAAAWPIGGKFLPEFLRSILYDRVINALGPLIGTYGPSIILVAVGFYLFSWSRTNNRPLAKYSVARPETIPMHEVVARVVAKTHDDNSAKKWPDSRRAIRQAALDGEIQISGHKSEDTGGANGTSWSLVSTPIPKSYWELADITEVATYAGYADDLMHSTREHQLSDGRFTNEKISYYAKLTATRSEVEAKWP